MTVGLGADAEPMNLCECGCGRPVHRRYATGHNRRLSPIEYVVEDRGYETPCWIWQRSVRDKKGYGSLLVNGSTVRAHRHFYEQARGPIPEGMQLDHRCRVRRCVNPDHLEVVTSVENTRRGNRAKLTVDQVRVIRAAPAGQNQVLAERYGVARQTIVNLRSPSSSSWRDVGPAR